jgi:Viral BACON domain
VRVIGCPSCQEPLPGTAKYCAKCGKHLPASEHSLNMVDENVVAPTIEICHRPAAQKVTRFFAKNAGNGTNTQHASSRITATVQRPQSNDLVSSNQTNPAIQPQMSEQDVTVDELHRRANWEKVVTHKTPRVAPVVETPPAVPVVYKSLASSTPPALISVRSTPPKKPPRLPMRFFSWISILVLLSLLLGGVFGLAVSFGRGFLAQATHISRVFELKVTPSNSAIGGIITLHGTGFSPNGRIGLTRDTNIILMDIGGMNIIHADSQGSFSDTVIVDPSWEAGSHIIHAEDAISHKSASFTVFVTGQSMSLRPSHLLFSPNTIDLGSGDQATNTTQFVTLSNTGGGQIIWQATATQPWLLITPKSGTLSYNQKMSVEVAADRSNLQVGVYAAGLFFTSNTGQAALPVQMSVTQLQPGHEAVLQLTPALVSFTGTDGAANPPSQIVTVSNPGVLSLQWTATSVTNDGSSWLSIYPQSGTAAKGGSQAVTISVNTSTMLPGVYSGSLTFVSQGTIAAKDSPQTIFVSLVVLPQCSIQISPGGLTFASALLQPSPTGKVMSLGVSQGCSAALPWSTTVTTSSGGKWLSIGPTGGVTPANPVVTVNSTGLKPGAYNGSITFNWPGGTQDVPITFTVSQATTPIVTAAPATIAFSGIIGKTVSLTQALTITNNGGGTLAWKASAVTAIGGAWLSISSTSGTILPHVSSPITVTATLLRTLTAGTYTGTITIVGTDSLGHPANGSPISIPVNLVVRAPLCILQAPSVAAETFSAEAGSNPKTQAFTAGVTGNCTGKVTITPTTSMASGTGWLTVSPASATVPSGASAQFTVSVKSKSARLAPGKYTGSISLTASLAAVNGVGAIRGNPQVIGITLKVLAKPALKAGTGSAVINVSAGTISQPIIITNSGGSALNWTAALGTGAPSYFSLHTASGTNLAGHTTTSISVFVNTTGLAGGTTVTTNVVISAIDPLTGQPVAGSPVTVPITINMPPSPQPSPTPSPQPSPTPSPQPSPTPSPQPSPTPSPQPSPTPSPQPSPTPSPQPSPTPQNLVSTNALAFTTMAGTNPTTQTVNVQNPGGNTLTWTAGAPSQPWLAVSPTTGSDTAGQTTPLTFTVDATGMSAGTYTATVIITPSASAPVTVNVSLTIN